ncbi:hypothetical protein [Hoyosella subflava]|uniref:DUF3093 domain-containing protein n=1 Tax=Hoyosella subflava (strain DSM 45089 / JCM 17490 / NBRC 109087 / DQS3-9A1) TaxID=443218 RepID=F6EKD0_HOYSD|nr:hypothetical protein [Hoyosella subflava]AEF39101.1 hypothetical protein AS9A_0647 [Hoyosella subflava DQS3-9A1]
MTDEFEFFEPGAQWRALLFGPVFCTVGIVSEIFLGGPVHWVGWLVAAALLTAVVGWQVYAGRTHLRVELTPHYLRQGEETLALEEIAELLPPEGTDRWGAGDWQMARALGELHGVPRRRTGVGLRLQSGSIVQAWARDHHTLRAALQRLLVAS